MKKLLNQQTKYELIKTRFRMSVEYYNIIGDLEENILETQLTPFAPKKNEPLLHFLRPLFSNEPRNLFL